MKIRNLDHLKYFIDAVELGGVVASAEKNRVVTSTVSQAIRQLESQLGVELLDHARNAFIPTPAAAVLVEHGKELLSQSAAMEKNVLDAAIQRKDVPHLRIGVSRSLATRFLPEALEKLRKSEPLLKITLYISKTLLLEKELIAGNIDLMIGLHERKAGTSSSKVLARGYFSLMRADKIKVPETYLVTEDRKEVLVLSKWYRERRGHGLPIAMRADSWEVLFEYCRGGLGIALLPDFYLSASTGLKVVENAPELPTYVVSITQAKGSKWLRKVEHFFTATASISMRHM